MEIKRLDGAAPVEAFEQMARIHRAEISGGFLSSLGDRFLVNLYRHLAASSHAFVYGAFEGERMVGFICGSMNTSRVYREFFVRSGLRSIWILLPKLFSVKRVLRIFETLLYPSKKQEVDLPDSEILNFCVSSETQGKGLGKLLFMALVEEFRARGVPEIRIVTGETQLKAQAFYDRHRAKRVTQFEVHKGTASVIYTYEIGTAAKA